MWIARDSRRGDFFRIDPLFTMSDNARASKRRPRPSNTTNAKDFPYRTSAIPAGGARRDRTDDLLLAKQALSQLSYGPSSNQWSVISNQKRLPSQGLITEY
jgi:hypothetical protein